MNEQQLDFLEQFGKLNRQVSIKTLTTVHIGGMADGVLYPKDSLALIGALKYCQKNNIETFIFGNGSNLLASDEPFHGLIIKLTRTLNQIYFMEDKLLVEAGVSLPLLAQVAMKNGLSGLEWSAGIPGSVGGATYMNAGAYLSDMSDSIEKVMIFDGENIVWLTNEECEFAYRSSIFKKHHDWIILAVLLECGHEDIDKIKEVMDDRRNRRIASQPLNEYTFGSVFRNTDRPSWQYIDEAGFRGYRVGDVQVSNQHSNFIINIENAKFNEMIECITTIQDEVYKKFGVSLKLEVESFNWNKQTKLR